jgi:hypothetical protein
MNLDNELWVAAALLQRNSERRDLPVSDIKAQLRRLNPSRAQQKAVSAYLSDHCVANKKRNPHSIGARIFVDVGYGLRRLYRPGDPTHPDRVHGKYKPERSEIPEKYWPLLDWYENEYQGQPGPDATAHPQSSPKTWVQFVGYINAHDLELMKKAIEEDFEKVYPE